MKKILIVVLVIILTLSVVLYSGCTLKKFDLNIADKKPLNEYNDRQVVVFSGKEELVEYFSANELYQLSSDFNQKIDKLESNHFFDKKNIVFLTLCDLSSDSTVKATIKKQSGTTEITFTINYGILDDIGVHFFFFEIAKGEYEYKFESSK